MQTGEHYLDWVDTNTARQVNGPDEVSVACRHISLTATRLGLLPIRIEGPGDGEHGGGHNQ